MLDFMDPDDEPQSLTLHLSALRIGISELRGVRHLPHRHKWTRPA